MAEQTAWWIIVESSPSQQATNKLFSWYPPGVPVYFQGTKAQATEKANLTIKTGSTSNGPFGPFASKKDAENAWKDGSINQHAGTGGPANPSGQAPNPLSGLQAIGAFFSDLSQASTWIRVAEVLAGLILIAVGVARITHAVPVATKVARAVGTKGLA